MGTSSELSCLRVGWWQNYEGGERVLAGEGRGDGERVELSPFTPSMRITGNDTKTDICGWFLKDTNCTEH